MRLLALVLAAGTLAGFGPADPSSSAAPTVPSVAEALETPPDRVPDRRLRRDVRQYVREVDRAVGLDRRQARRLADLLERRARRALRADRRLAYPFPRTRRTDRRADAFWDRADRLILDELGRRQRADYRHFARQFEERRDRRRDRRRRGRRHG